MILCLWQGEWGTAQRLLRASQGCSVAVRNSVGPSLEQSGFVPYVYGTFWDRPFNDLSSIRFFPVIRWKGILVTPARWHRESSEPLLFCRMETHELGAKSEREYKRLVEDIRTLGWHWDLMEGGHKYIHVDDLEKIEGPAPDGPF